VDAMADGAIVGHRLGKVVQTPGKAVNDTSGGGARGRPPQPLLPKGRHTARDLPQEIAPGVYRLAVGRGFLRANVYFVRSGATWSLIDTGSAECAPVVMGAARSLFGKDLGCVAILLTHDHPDHAGSAAALAGAWGCDVWVHADELPLTAGDIGAIRRYANPLDRRLILPAMRLIGRERTERIVSRAGLKGIARPLDAAAGVPGLPDWEAVHTPGHTPGHVVLFRPGDRVLVSGDALLTINLNSMVSVMRRKQQIAGPPWYVTWDMRAAKASIARLALLEPRTVSGGHGRPISGSDTPRRLAAFADRMRG